MALTLDELNATTQEYWEPGAQDVYYKGNVLIGTMLKGAKTWDGGTYIRQVLDYGQPMGGDFSATDVFNTNKVETMTAARWTPGYYYEPVVYDIDDMVKNAGLAQQVDIINQKLTKAQKHLRSKLADDLYASTDYGNSGHKLVGLLGMISSSSTYGGIAVADLAEWVAGAVSSTATPITFGVIDTLLTSCMVGDDAGDEPDLLVTTRNLFSAIRSQTMPHLRLEHGSLADMGFKNIDYIGNPIVRDYKCPAGYLFAVNKNYMGFRVHKSYNFKRTPWEKPVGQEKYACYLMIVLQMICKRRDAHGVYSALTA
jgi:hypothetical protein